MIFIQLLFNLPQFWGGRQDHGTAELISSVPDNEPVRCQGHLIGCYDTHTAGRDPDDAYLHPAAN